MVVTYAVLVAAYLLSQFFRAFLAVIAPELARDIGLDPADLGLVSGAFFAAFALAQVPIGMAFDRIGPRVTVSVLMLAAVAGSALFGVASRPWHPVAGMALIGIGCAPVFMGALFVIGRTAGAARFATLSSAIVGVGSLGNIFAATPFAATVAAIGWRNAMLSVAVLTLAGAAAVALLLRDPPPPAGAAKATGNPFAMGEVLRIRELWPMIPLALTGYPILAAVRGLWIGPYFSEVHGLGPLDRGNAVMVMGFAMILGSFVYGPLDRLFGTRKWVVASGSAVTVAALAVLALRPEVGVIGATIAFAAIGAFGMTYGVAMAHARAFLPEHVLGRGLSLMNACMIGGAGLLQPVSGILVGHFAAAGTPPAATFAILFGGFAVALTAALAVYLLARDARPARD
ncbi:MFS transporter [Prosthecodimorpha staleyi]|uniref:MFS transporter n=1 Tax=Prosthecodimorpha staleyi TaxID=2840188 RepID=A0A947D7V8_9HYPH|nr:MFS transporter [Prosthecodimorpha staleyi]MBT9288449.1 MFS transporter [Prosthecodimorpha staleyi]